jgi:hypothetical protein
VVGPHAADGADAHSHLLLNDDPDGAADKWRISAIAPGPASTSEWQAVEIAPNHILVAARSPVAMQRSQIGSTDGGETLGHPYYVPITEPLGGCEGSILNHEKAGLLFYSGTVNRNPERFNMIGWLQHREDVGTELLPKVAVPGSPDGVEVYADGLLWLHGMSVTKPERTHWRGGVLADAMGLGKTVSLLALIVASTASGSRGR